MDDLVAFLRARLDEDDLTVREANTSPEMVTGIPRSYAEAPVAIHIARFASPDRVLREVEAKRRILEVHGGDRGAQSMFCPHCEHDAPCPTLRLLALPFADHPDYQPEWDPSA
jgi:hypothetical protein